MLAVFVSSGCGDPESRDNMDPLLHAFISSPFKIAQCLYTAKHLSNFLAGSPRYIPLSHPFCPWVFDPLLNYLVFLLL